MTAKMVFRSIAVLGILVGSLASSTSVWAGVSCPLYWTVQKGDTLKSIAEACRTTPAALHRANPRIDSYPPVGQVVYIPGGVGSTPASQSGQVPGILYAVQSGDTLGGIALLFGVSVVDLRGANPQIGSAGAIFPGLVLTIPTPGYHASAPMVSTPMVSTPVAFNPFKPGDSGILKITYAKGLLIRTGPGRQFSQIVSPLISVMGDTHWMYRKSSLTTDSVQFVWVEISLGQTVNGNSTGWILVRDSLGGYYTKPPLGSVIKHNDP